MELSPTAPLLFLSLSLSPSRAFLQLTSLLLASSERLTSGIHLWPRKQFLLLPLKSYFMGFPLGEKRFREEFIGPRDTALPQTPQLAHVSSSESGLSRYCTWSYSDIPATVLWPTSRCLPSG